MPVDLSPLRAPLPPLQKPGLDASDDRLMTLDSLAEKDRWDAAAAVVGEMMAAGIYDIRPISYLLYAAFVEDGFRGLGDLLDVLDGLLGPGMESLGPERRREEHVNKRLGWLFERIASSLEYHEKHQGRDWTLWKATLSIAAVERALEAGARVAGRMESVLYTRAATSLAQVMARLRRHEQSLRAEAPAEAAGGAPAAAGTAGTAGSGEAARERTSASGAGARSERETSGAAAGSPASAARAEPAALRPADVPSRTLTRVELLAAQPFLDLCRKLAAFEALVKKGQLEKAALVAEDVAAHVEAFDPRVHFPDLFAGYARLFAKHAVALQEHAEAKGPAWNAMMQHYRVDLDGFVEG